MNLPFILACAAALASLLLAMTVAWSERRSVAHWGFVAGMLALSIESAFLALASDSAIPAEAVQWQNRRMMALSFLPATWLFFSLCYARGNYQATLAKWRVPLVLALVLPAGVALFLNHQLMSLVETESGAVALRVGWPGTLINLVFLLAAILVLVNLERTFRASVGTMRWRIKFMVIGLGVLFAARVYVTSQVLLYHSTSLALQMIASAGLLVGCLLIFRSLLRPGLFEVQVYPSQAVIRNSLTLLLAGAYLALVGAVAKAVAFFGGDAATPLKASVVILSLVLLTLLLLSDRFRLYSQQFVSRHFQRPLYDYRTVWKTFTEGTANCVEQADLSQAIVKLSSNIFQALSVTLWIVDNRKELAFGASTFLSESKAAQFRLDPADSAQAVEALTAQTGPVDLDQSKERWASILRRLHPEEFHKGGNRICAPMVAGGELVGVLILGDRVGGVQFLAQDLDLLKAVSDHSAASLMTVRLSHRLAQSRQLEAFQTMSAFFVHDLKNTASTLSLMLQNLPHHFDDPEFRKDALRGIGKTVTHINELISRLSLLRQELVVNPVETDLNALVESALKCLGEPPSVELDKTFEPVPKVALDPAQIRNVVTNLVLNARDALGAGGRITLKTTRRNGWVALSVHDNGCGMTPEFISRSLFRPFQTTKKKGIGIGMFQCKMIVEAHRGRIEVESAPGQGTTFTVLLPLGPNS
jgi:putative PEP-CTERM system histidine kinase